MTYTLIALCLIFAGIATHLALLLQRERKHNSRVMESLDASIQVSKLSANVHKDAIKTVEHIKEIQLKQDKEWYDRCEVFRSRLESLAKQNEVKNAENRT